MGVVCQPTTFTQLELGYIFKEGKVLPVQEVDLKLWAHGEMTGKDPKDFGFRFKAGGEWHDVQVENHASLRDYENTNIRQLNTVGFHWIWNRESIHAFCCIFKLDDPKGLYRILLIDPYVEQFSNGELCEYLILPQVRVLDTVEVFFGWQWEGRVLERFCEFTVDGVRGWGISEWQFRHGGGRPEELRLKDPARTLEAIKY